MGYIYKGGGRLILLAQSHPLLHQESSTLPQWPQTVSPVLFVPHLSHYLTGFDLASCDFLYSLIDNTTNALQYNMYYDTS